MTQGSESVLVLAVAGDLYALAAEDVSRVVEPGPLATIPALPTAVAGITHHRGRIVTVIDAAHLVLGRRPGPLPPTARLVVLEALGRNVALLCDAVFEMAGVLPQDGSPPPVPGGLVRRIHVLRGRACHLLSTEALVRAVERLCQADGQGRPGRLSSPTTPHPVAQTGPGAPT